MPRRDAGEGEGAMAASEARRPLGIRLICLQKTVWGLALLGLAAALFALRATHQTQPFQELFENELAQDPHDLLANFLIGLAPRISPRAELLIGAGATVYAILEAIEVWGLWTDRLWVELLVVAETAAFLPYEVWELVRHFTPFKVLSIAINTLIVWYLLARYLRKREERLLRELRADLRGRAGAGREEGRPPAREKAG